MSKKIKTFLTLSIVFNIFFIGLFIGNYTYRKMYHKKNKTHFIYKNIYKLTEELPKGKKYFYEEKLKNLIKENEIKFINAKNLKTEIINILSNEQINMQEYNFKKNEMYNITEDAIKSYYNYVTEIAIYLPVKKRKKIIKMLTKKPRRF